MYRNIYKVNIMDLHAVMYGSNVCKESLHDLLSLNTTIIQSKVMAEPLIY